LEDEIDEAMTAELGSLSHCFTIFCRSYKNGKEMGVNASWPFISIAYYTITKWQRIICRNKWICIAFFDCIWWQSKDTDKRHRDNDIQSKCDVLLNKDKNLANKEHLLGDLSIDPSLIIIPEYKKVRMTSILAIQDTRRM
jgi:hypothetical protein